MTKNLEEHGLFSLVQQRTNHKDFQNCLFACFLSQVEPKKLQEVWTLVDLPNGKRAIGTKWVFRNKKDERGIVIKNKARLVAQGYTQEERIDYDEVFAPVARIEAIRLFLAYASFKDFVVYQMDVKSAFLYGKIEEEVYVCQPPGFEDPNFPDRVYKVEKALYGLHQAPRAWYETLSTYLLDNGFQRGTFNKTLFIRRDKGDILLVQVYVDDIIFGSTKKSLCTEFEKMMHKKFQMSSMGELTFFLGLQTASTPMETQKPLLKDEDGEEVDIYLYRSMIGSLMYLTFSRPEIMFAVYSPFDLVAYTDSDYAGASLDRKSTIGGCQFLECRLISWQCKKQTVVDNSTTEAEYVAASSCYSQVLWIQNQLLDYGYNFMHTKIYIDNNSTICIVKNPVFNSKTKHIEIRQHFIRDSNEKKLIQMIKIHTNKNVADLLTKAFDASLTTAGLLLLMKVNAFRHNFLLPVQVNVVEVFLDKQVGDMSTHDEIYVTPSHTKKVFGNMKKDRKGFSGNITPLFPTMMVQAQEEMGEEPIADEDANEENVPTHSNDPLPSGEDRLKLNELMELYTQLQQRVLDMENTKTAQAQEITSLKKRVKKLEKKQRSRPHKLKRLYKVGLSAKVVSSKDKASLGDQEDASKQGRKIQDNDADKYITLDSTHFDTDPDMFGVHDLDSDEVFVETEEPVVNAARTTSTILVSVVKDLFDVDMTLAQALAELRHAKPKAVTTTATTTTTAITRSKAKGLVIQE
ncbi:putative ribonuclease H-like domain-containing protein [Tanacetum coccineum]